MPLSTLKEEGQITLPSSILERLHAVTGDTFDFQLQRDDTVLMTKKRKVEVKARPAEAQKKDLSRWIGAKPNVFGSAKEADEFIRKQRDPWT